MSVADTTNRSEQIQPLRRVHAKMDLRSIHDEMTRWTPRLVECVEDQSDATSARIDCIIKYRRNSGRDPDALRNSAAMSISEVVASAVLRDMDIRTPNPLLVYVSEEYARSYDSMCLGYQIVKGYHFATEFMSTATHAVPEPVHEHLANPYDVVRLWLIDSWLANSDRTQRGNALYLPLGNKWQMVAVDHSDCFGGAGRLADGTALDDPARQVECGWLEPPFMKLMFTADGINTMRKTVEDIKRTAPLVCNATRLVPDQWWQEACVDPPALECYLKARAGKIDEICQVQQWERDYNAAGGAILLDL